MNYSIITEADKTNLVAIIIETSEEVLDFDLFTELVATLSEDIPGLEFITEDELASLITDCWEIYLAAPVAHSLE